MESSGSRGESRGTMPNDPGGMSLLPRIGHFRRGIIRVSALWGTSSIAVEE